MYICILQAVVYIVGSFNQFDVLLEKKSENSVETF